MDKLSPVHKTLLFGSVGRWLARRRFPSLLLIVAALLGLDLLVPDPVPFADEIILMALTAMLAGWRKRRSDR